MSIELHNRIVALEARVKEFEQSAKAMLAKLDEMLEEKAKASVAAIKTEAAHVKESIANWPKRKAK